MSPQRLTDFHMLKESVLTKLMINQGNIICTLNSNHNQGEVLWIYDFVCFLVYCWKNNWLILVAWRIKHGNVIPCSIYWLEKCYAYLIMFASLCTVTTTGVHMGSQSFPTFYMPMNYQDVSRCASWLLL